MTGLPFIVGAYAAGAAGVVGYAVTLARRQRQARERRDALDRRRDTFPGGTAAHPAAGAGEGRARNAP